MTNIDTSVRRTAVYQGPKGDPGPRGPVGPIGPSVNLANIPFDVVTWGNGTGTNVESDKTPTGIVTLNATPVVIAVVQILPGKAIYGEYVVKGKSLSSADAFRQNFSLDAVRYLTGNAVVATDVPHTAATIGAGSTWSCVKSVVGNTLVFTVAGDAALQVSWSLVRQKIED